MIYFSLPDDAANALLVKAVETWHPDLAENKVRVQMLFADTDGDGPAVRHGGYPAIATIRVVPLRDRLTKGYDAEMLVSRPDWDLMTAKHKLALLDHELSHLEVIRKEVKQPRGRGRPRKDEVVEKEYVVAFDDLGRPKLKLRKGDWNAGDGFSEVVYRHGDYAAEFGNITRAYAAAYAAKEEGEANGDAPTAGPGSGVTAASDSTADEDGEDTALYEQRAATPGTAEHYQATGNPAE